MDLHQAADERLEDVRNVLRGLVAERGFSLREVDRCLGRSAGYTHQALSGKFQLTVRHLFQILAAVEISPEDFYRRMLSRSSEGYLLDTELNREMLRSIHRAGEIAARLQGLEPNREAPAESEGKGEGKEDKQEKG